MKKTKHDALEEYVTVSEAAAMMGITPQAIRRALKERRIQGKKVGKMWLIKRDQFVQVNRNGHEPA